MPKKVTSQKWQLLGSKNTFTSKTSHFPKFFSPKRSQNSKNNHRKSLDWYNISYQRTYQFLNNILIQH